MRETTNTWQAHEHIDRERQPGDEGRMGLNYDTWAGALEQGQRPYKNHQHNFSGPGPEGLTNRDRVRQYIGHFGAAGGGSQHITTYLFYFW